MSTRGTVTVTIEEDGGQRINIDGDVRASDMAVASWVMARTANTIQDTIELANASTPARPALERVAAIPSDLVRAD